MKKLIIKIPLIGPLAVRIKKRINARKFGSTEKYWIDRYKSGGNSGQGSYDRFAIHKAEVVNDFVAQNKIQSVIELGCGDGNQLTYYKFPSYIGFEISPPAIALCKQKFSDDNTKAFFHLSELTEQRADLTISMDVVYCLVEESIYEDHLRSLFDSSKKYVLVFSSNHTKNNDLVPHMKHRKFTDWVNDYRPDFELMSFVKNKFADEPGIFVSDFYFFKKRELNPDQV